MSSTPVARKIHTVTPTPPNTPPRVIRPLDCAQNVTLPLVANATIAGDGADQVLLYQGRPISLSVFLEANPNAVIVT